MKLIEVDELTTWMIQRKILHLSYDGVTISLHESALYPQYTERSEQEDRPSRVIEPLYDLTPQERIRREYLESLNKVES